MKVVLIRDTRIQHKAGEIVEVSPVVFDFLVSTQTAKPVKEAAQAKRRTRKEK